MSKNIYYLDNNATTPTDPEVIQAMMPYFSDQFYNPSSVYGQAQGPKHSIEKARKEIASFIGASIESEIIFMGSASEANNLGIKGVLAANSRRKHIITTTVEHPSVHELCLDLERSGYEVSFLGVDNDGKINVKDLIKEMRPDTAIVSIMHGNNETGVVFPIETFSRVVKLTDPNIIFHTDATQTIGKIPIDLKTSFPYVDMLSFSGHKIYAPKGIGVLYCKRGTPYRSIIVGGHQEKGRRAGTENVPYIMGLARACQLAEKHMKEDEGNIKKMRDKLEKFVLDNIPAVKINGSDSPRLDSTSNLSFQGIEGESLLYALNEHGICASTGSACSSGSLAPSHVLQAMHIPFSFVHGSLRISFGRFNQEKDLEYLIEVLPNVVSRLREISPFWDNEKNVPIEDFDGDQDSD